MNRFSSLKLGVMAAFVFSGIVCVCVGQDGKAKYFGKKGESFQLSRKNPVLVATPRGSATNGI